MMLNFMNEAEKELNLTKKAFFNNSIEYDFK